MPNLCRTVSSMDKSKVFSVAEVIGQLSVQSLAEYIEDVCAKQRAVDVEVEKLGLKHLPAVGSADEERKLILGDNGMFGFSIPYETPVQLLTLCGRPRAWTLVGSSG
jgi:hypothetical protein